MDDEDGFVRHERREDVSVVLLDRPAALNAMSTHMLDALEKAITTAEAAAGAIVLAAEGPHFCVGADLQEVSHSLKDPARTRAFLTRFQRAADVLQGCSVPVIAAVNGMALAGGLELALACDLILVSASAQLGDQHIELGLIPGGGGSQRLPRAIGARAALGLQLTGDRWDADEAVARGLAYRKVPDGLLRDEAAVLAIAIASKDPDAVRRIRHLNAIAADQPLREGLRLELDTAVEHLASTAVRSRIDRFFEERAARGADTIGDE